MSTSNLPPSKRFLRRIKSGIFQFAPIYRLYLRFQYGAHNPSLPARSPLPNGVLQSKAEYLQAFQRARELRLPLHRAAEKNWDHIAAVNAIVHTCPRSACILDAGAEIYSNVLPALFVYGYRDLYAMNLSFADPACRGPIRYLPGDITRTGFDDGFFDAITCMSVIEHGVPIQAYFQEMFRVLKPGGILITSTDYYPEPVDTRGQVAHGAPIKIFSRTEAEEIFRTALRCGFELTGEIPLHCSARPIRWEAYDLEYTVLIFTLQKPA